MAGLLDHFFRHQHGRLLAGLVRALGSEHLDLAEAAAQEALTRALRVWPLRGIPDDPAAWLLLVARNHAIDELRKHARAAGALQVIEHLVERGAEAGAGASGFAAELRDDQLAMMFMCCDPELKRTARVALTLKVVSGFGTAEIARAFFCSEPTVAQRIVRAKRCIVARGRPLSIPPPPALPARLDAVLDVLYLMFNEGYTHRDSSGALRRDLCEEAIRLADLLARHPTVAMPRVHALHALMLLQSSRMSARQDAGGWLLPISAQDRSRWDRRRIAQGLRALGRAGSGDELSDYHLLAGIAAAHATAPSWETTDWRRIVALYDRLVAGRSSFVLELNRAVAVSMLRGPAAGLALLDELDARRAPRAPRSARDALARYHHLATARGDFHERLGQLEQARAAFARAAALAPNERERSYLTERAARCARRDSESS